MYVEYLPKEDIFCVCVLLHFIVQWRDSTVILMLYRYTMWNSVYMHNRSISYYVSDEILVHFNMDVYGNSYNYI